MARIKKMLNVQIRIAIAVLILGLLGKAMRWPFANATMFIGFFGLGLFYTIRFWKKPEKHFTDYVKLILVTFWATNGMLRILEFPYTIFFQIITAITFIIWFIMEGTAYFFAEERKSKNSLAHILWNTVLILGTLSVILGSLFKVLEIDFAVPVLILGIVLIIAYITKDLFVSKTGGKGNKGEIIQS